MEGVDGVDFQSKGCCRRSGGMLIIMNNSMNSGLRDMRNLITSEKDTNNT